MPSSAPNRPEFRARYLVESSVPSDRVAEVIAGEQSSGTFLALPGETEQLKERSRDRVVRVQSLPPVFEPTPANAAWPRACRSGAWPARRTSPTPASFSRRTSPLTSRA